MRAITYHEVTGTRLKDLQTWRAEALEIMPYFASILFSLRTLDTPGLGTMAVDRHMRLYIDFEAVADWPKGKCAQVLLHECGHIFGNHAALADDLCVTADRHKVWNIATDAAINDDLVAAGLSQLHDGVLPGQFGQPDYLTPIDYYRALCELVDAGPDSGSDSEAETGGDGEADGDQGDGPGTDSDDPFRGCGSASGGQPAPVELAADDDCDSLAQPATDLEIDLIRVRTATAIREEAGKRPGTVPGGLVGTAEDFFTRSQVSWRSELSMLIRRGVRIGTTGALRRTYRLRDRRSHARKMPGSQNRAVIRPGRASPRASIHVVRDTSGSMSGPELQAVTREVAAISASLRIKGQDLLITDCDVTTSATRAWNGAESLRTVTGGGGTDMGAAACQVLADRDQDPPSALVVITDGYTPWMETHPDPRVPIIACIICDESAYPTLAKRTPDFITALRVDPDLADDPRS